MAIIDEMMGTSFSVGPERPELHFWHAPKYSYRVHINDGFVINIIKGQEPNWFYRWMQRICFGFRWEKID